MVTRPFAGLSDECDWVALREVVPAATAPLALAEGERAVLAVTVLPLGCPAMVRADGSVWLSVQAPSRSGDLSRDLAQTLEQALSADPGTSITSLDPPGPGPRLQELLAPVPLTVNVHAGFEFWTTDEPEVEPSVTAAIERANAYAVPTARLASVQAAYWCRIRTRTHLRWVLPHAEDTLLDALARLGAGDKLGLGEGTRYVGSFRAHGLLVPVWDLPEATQAGAMEEPAAQFAVRLAQALAEDEPLSAAQRRARAGLLGRQLTLR